MNATPTMDAIEIRTAGIRALIAALGQEGAKTFLTTFSGTGDFTKERREWPELPNDEVFDGIMKLQEEGVKNGKKYIMPRVLN